MNTPNSVRKGIRWPVYAVVAIVAATVVGGSFWLRGSDQAGNDGSPLGSAGDGHRATHAGHDHDHDDADSIRLSASALSNIGFEPLVVKRETYTRTLTVPAMVVERPGRSQLHVTAPLTGTVTRIEPIEGAAVSPGDPLFEIHLTHEELVTAQRDLIRTAESLEVVNRELSRLRSLSEGVVAGRRILEQEYERQKLEAALAAERQALLLHGLSEEQIDRITGEKQLFHSLTVRAPEHSEVGEGCRQDHAFHVQRLPVKLGQQVAIGELLCVLADHCELYIEGQAFEDDAAALRRATGNDWPLSASLVVGQRESESISGLELLYLADHVDPQSRAFRFYVRLPNEVSLEKTVGRHTFVEWRFKPGQRMQVHVPIERLSDRIVLPVDAVVEEGAETYVYRQNGQHFERVTVRVEHRDSQFVVIADDGSLFPGDVVAARGAYQLHLALKNQTGGAVDPHAGHNH